MTSGVAIGSAAGVSVGVIVGSIVAAVAVVTASPVAISLSCSVLPHFYSPPDNLLPQQHLSLHL